MRSGKTDEKGKCMVGKEDVAVTKLTLIAYSDNKFSPKSMLGVYSVMINPESIKRQFKIKTDNKQTVGATGIEGIFQNMLPETISFDLVIDGTGALGGNNGKYTVSIEIEKLLSVVYKIQKEKFDVNYVQILYGAISAKCVLESLNISYVLFHREGHPLRAKVGLSFTSIQNSKKEQKKKSQHQPQHQPRQPEGASGQWECVKWRRVEKEGYRSGNSNQSSYEPNYTSDRNYSSVDDEY